MKRFLPYIIVALAALWVLSTLRGPKNADAFDVAGFSRLPVVVNGRVKPLDTVARTSLLVLQGKQRAKTPEGKSLAPAAWLLDVLFAPEKADTYRTFEIVHPDVLALFNLTTDDGDGGKRFSFTQLEKGLPELQRQTQLAQPVEPQLRTPFQKDLVRLHSNVNLYQRLKYSLSYPGATDFLSELMQFQETLAAGVEAVRAKQAGQPHDEAAANRMIALGQNFIAMSQAGYLLAIPALAGENHEAEWLNAGNALLQTFETGQVSPFVLTYAGIGRTWRSGNADQFNEIVRLYRQQLERNYAATLKKCDAEVRFNSAEPFYVSTVLYVLAFLLGVFSWLRWPETLGRAGFWIVALAWVLTTVGIATRMWLEGRPPVTNLYSSALFVGWGSVALCLILEAVYKNAIGTVAAGAVGFLTLLIAHHLSLGGDTMEMMRAVLDSNFWLATHVVTVTIGYSATFLAGFLAIIYIVRGFFTASLDRATADALSRMVYGIICFATLFSFVGTVLGGIWADQSWGRFWGWDPKENGALMIVVWNAIILHCRWGGLVKQRGLMNLAIFGNIITSWSWFGTNMLGVGLHSYGFTDAAFVALSSFVASQLALIAIACTRLEKWRSFREKPVNIDGIKSVLPATDET